MPDFAQVRDLTRTLNGVWTPGPTDEYRANPGSSYAPLTLMKLATADLQLGTDSATVIPTGTTATENAVLGIVSLDFGTFGFDSIGTTTYPGSAAALRGDAFVKLYREGNAYGLLDQSGTGAATVVPGSMLQASRATAGYMQGSSTAALGVTVAYAVLPATNLAGTAVSLAAGALTQGSNTVTIAGTPAVGDVITVTFQVPYNFLNPGVAQTQTVTYTLLTADAVSVTAAALAVSNALKANAAFAKYYTSTPAAGVITIAAAGPQFSAQGVPTNLFQITYTLGGGINISPSGQLFNGATLASTATGGSTATTAGNIASGVGYKGVIPCFVVAP